MAQYINKAALVAEIERRKEINKYRDTPDGLFEDEAILSFINTLEVKEVDLEKEINEWLLHNDITNTRYTDYCDDDIIETAEHFFELGIKAAQKGE